MGRRARGTGGSRVRVLAIEEVDEDALETSGPPARSEVPDGGASVPGAAGAGASHDSSGAGVPGDERPARRSWSRRSGLLVGAGAVVVALLVGGGVVRGELNESARVERVVAAGGVRPLGSGATVEWRIDPPRPAQEDFQGMRWVQPAVVDGTLVVPGDPVVGYDPDTGQERWRGTPQPAGSAERLTGCSGTGTWWAQEGPLVCTTSEIRAVPMTGGTFEHLVPVRLEVMVATTGEVTGSRAFDEGTQGAAVFDDGIATVRWGDEGQAVVDLEDMATGEPRWSREIAVERGSGADASYLGLQDGGSVLMVAVAGRLVTLDADGRTVDGAEEAWTAPLRDGRARVQHRDGGSTVLDRDGTELFRARSMVQEFETTDGAPTRLYFVTAGGGVMDESGEIDPVRTAALDPATGQTLWSTDGVDAPVAQVGDVGVLSGAGRLWAVDLGSGERLWESSGVRTYTSAHTDGTDLYLVGTSASGGTSITAISVDSGHELWSSELEDSVIAGMGVNGRLVVMSADGGLLGIG
ncbi:outer membrane protein assembly factor BamB family protein [Oerskovia jenensis]|uniref:outer membrane protein assembly factor BamB family protein n=1 Tax=Oerskovia jenensis TaxID=162169 RepID=UPI0036DE8470